MQLNLITTPEQDAAIAALNLKSNPDGKTADADFAVSLIGQYLDSFAVQEKANKVGALIEQLKAKQDTLTDQDIADISSTLDAKVVTTTDTKPLTP
jgi:hypothetical protein